MKRCSKKVLLICILWIFSNQIIGQPSYIFHHIETSDGLSNNSVHTVLRDRHGFLWIGTESGLNRFDGYGFKVYTMHPGIPNTLISNNIIGLQEDGLGNLWVNFGYGYMVYNRDKDYFISDVIKILKDLGIKAEQNCKVYVDKKQNLWVLNKGSVCTYNIQNKTTNTFKLKTPVEDVVTLGLSDNGEFIYVIQRSGLCWQMNKNTGVQTTITLPDVIRKNVTNNSNTIFADSQNGLWLFSNKDEPIYYRRNPGEEWKIIELKSEIKDQSRIITIAEGQNGHIWIGTDHRGLFIYNKAEEKIANIIRYPWESTCLASNNLSSIYIDNNGVAWIGHNKNGLSFYHDSFQNFINIQHAECEDVTSILETRLGVLLLGTDGNGLYIKENENNVIKKLPLPNTAIITTLEDRRGRVWVGTYLKGLFCYEKGKIVQYTMNNSKLSNNDIWSLKEDRYGNLWIGTLGGKIQKLQFEDDNLNNLTTPFEENVYAMDMFYDGGDKIYVGTGYGLIIIDIKSNRKEVFYGNKRGTQQFNQEQILSVYKDGRDILWLGSSNGLTAWDLKKDTLYNFNKSNGLCDNIIRGITEDNLKNIWITTSNGLSILTVNRKSNDLISLSSRNFSVKDGLKNNYFNNHSICKLTNGDILLGSTDGYTIFDPNRMAEKNQPLAKVIFTGLTVGNQLINVDSVYNGHKLLNHSIELTSSLNIKYEDKLISLQFTTGDLLNADKVKYVYQIDGFNNQWISTTENKIALTSLPPGEYKLLIKACNSDGVWNPDPTELIINVSPPFYYSYWAFIIYILLIAGAMMFFVHKTKRRHYIKLEQQKIRLAQEQEIRLNEMKLKFFTNISHDLRTPLTLIITPLQVMLNEITDKHLIKKLSVIYKNAQQLLSLINSLLDFRKLDVGADVLHLKPVNIVDFVRDIYNSFHIYANDRNVNIHFLNEVKSLTMKFDQDKIHKTLTNLLSNAFKYTSDGGTISIHIYQLGDNVCISVSDSGPGISDIDKQRVFERFYQIPQNQENTGSGIGLHIASEYVKLHGGAITITNNLPHGSIFTFKLPIIVVNEIEDIELPEGNEEVKMAGGLSLNEKDNPRPVSPKLVLLFVDDNKDLCEFISDNLGNEYSVITAYNGQEAIDKLNNNDVSIVISDVMMPVMSGTELCNQIKTNINWSHIPVILLTAKTAEEYEIEGFELGADDYITKPFNLEILKLRVRKFIEWTEKSHRSFSQKIDVSPSEITITSIDEKLIEKAILVVEGHISDIEFSVETLGETLGLSRGHLYKKLMVITGKGPAEFIRTIRLKRGRQLIEKSQMQIAEIAYSVGFNSPKRFSINFKNEFGISPSEYLRKFENKQ